MLLIIISMLMNQRQDTSRERKMICSWSTLESAKIVSMVHAEVMEKWLTLCIHRMMTDFFQTIVDSNVVRLKASEVNGHVARCQEDVKHFSARNTAYK